MAKSHRDDIDDPRLVVDDEHAQALSGIAHSRMLAVLAGNYLKKTSENHEKHQIRG